MSSSESEPAASMQEDRRNGQGYWVSLPTQAIPLAEALPALGNYGDFTEKTEIVDELSKNHAVLLNGAPGSGKSHLVREFQMACMANRVSAFCLTVHVNAGKAYGLTNVKPHIDEFRSEVKRTGGGLVILDNIDSVGYRGKSRNHGITLEYVQSALPIVRELIDDPNLAILATGHDDAWREGRWTWHETAIDEPARAIIDAFPSRIRFEGKMALVALAKLLSSRNLLIGKEEQPSISIGKAALVVRLLHKLGRANFFNANHINVAEFLQNPMIALEQIDQEQDIRRGLSKPQNPSPNKQTSRGVISDILV